MWHNTQSEYGWISILLHWLTAALVVGLFALGLWMTDLTYYDRWYRSAPWIHKSIGVTLFAMTLARLAWRGIDPPPPPEAAIGRVEHRLARSAHALLYLLLLAVAISGYLISTADGQGVSVFGLLEVPATLSGLPQQADWAGEAHLVLAITLIAVASLHAGAALKHLLIDRDRTLARMLPGARRRTPHQHRRSPR